MKSQSGLKRLSFVVAGGVAALLLSASVFAQHGGGGGGGHAGGGGGGGHAGAVGGGHGYAGGGYRGGYAGGYRGGYAGGYRGGYYGGYHGGYGGWRGGYGWGGWGWGGLGLGLYFATLPLYYQTYWWGGLPYYYADNTYYTYDPNVKQYETVAPPEGLAAQNGTASPSADLIAYPKNGQSTEQQSTDKFECHQWAVGQSGFDPTTGGSAAANKRTDYMRAQAACLEGRGYSVQ